MGSCACIHKKGIDSGNLENPILVEKNNPKNLYNKKSFSSEENQKNIVNTQLINLYKNTTDRDLLSINQQRADTILEYFNQIKLNPQNFLEEAKENKEIDIFNKYIDSKERNLFIKNRFYNSLLESYVNRSPKSDKEIEKGIYNEVDLNKYDKQFYVVNSTVQDPNESVWLLLKQIKTEALNKILINNISFFILYVFPIENTPKIKVYFLFLKMKNN